MDTLQADIIETGLYLFQFVYGNIMASLPPTEVGWQVDASGSSPLS